MGVVALRGSDVKTAKAGRLTGLYPHYRSLSYGLALNFTLLWSFLSQPEEAGKKRIPILSSSTVTCMPLTKCEVIKDDPQGK